MCFFPVRKTHCYSHDLSLLVCLSHHPSSVSLSKENPAYLTPVPLFLVSLPLIDFSCSSTSLKLKFPIYKSNGDRHLTSESQWSFQPNICKMPFPRKLKNSILKTHKEIIKAPMPSQTQNSSFHLLLNGCLSCVPLFSKYCQTTNGYFSGSIFPKKECPTSSPVKCFTLFQTSFAKWKINCVNIYI